MSYILQDNVEQAPQAASANWLVDLYPDDLKAQILVGHLFELIDLHKTKTPFPDGKGPGVPGFAINELPIGIYANTNSQSTDLLIVNWTGPVPAEFSKREDISRVTGQSVFYVKNLEIRQLRTIDPNRDHFFESLFGAFFFGADDDPEGYLPKKHFLRAALGESYMPLIVPYSKTSNADLSVLNTIVHEAAHIFENRNRMRLLTDSSAFLGPVPNDSGFKVALKNKRLQNLLVAYERAVLDVIELTDGKVVADFLKAQPNQRSALGMVSAIAALLKKEFPDDWQTYLFYEYTEGMTEFVAAQTMIDAGLVSYPDQIRRETEDKEFAILPMFYRTGAFGGLFMRQSVGNFHWKQGHGYDPEGIWEKITSHFNSGILRPSEEAVQNYLVTASDVQSKISLLKDRFP